MSSNIISNNIDLNNKKIVNCFDADESVIIHKVDILHDLENIIKKLEMIGSNFSIISDLRDIRDFREFREISNGFYDIALNLIKIKLDLKN